MNGGAGLIWKPESQEQNAQNDLPVGSFASRFLQQELTFTGESGAGNHEIMNHSLNVIQKPVPRSAQPTVRSAACPLASSSSFARAD